MHCGGRFEIIRKNNNGTALKFKGMESHQLKGTLPITKETL